MNKVTNRDIVKNGQCKRLIEWQMDREIHGWSERCTNKWTEFHKNKVIDEKNEMKKIPMTITL